MQKHSYTFKESHSLFVAIIKFSVKADLIKEKQRILQLLLELYAKSMFIPNKVSCVWDFSLVAFSFGIVKQNAS